MAGRCACPRRVPGTEPVDCQLYSIGTTIARSHGVPGRRACGRRRLRPDGRHVHRHIRRTLSVGSVCNVVPAFRVGTMSGVMVLGIYACVFRYRIGVTTRPVGVAVPDFERSPS